MNNNFDLKKFLTEGKLLIEVDNNEIKQIFDEKVQEEYKPLVGTDPIYDGLEEVLNSPKTFQDVVDGVNDTISSYDDEDLDPELIPSFTADTVDFTIMGEFAPRLVKNLLAVGFKYDSDDESWTIPEKYIVDDEMLTSYGIIWDIWGVDYDTSIREIVSDYLEEAAQEIA